MVWIGDVFRFIVNVILGVLRPLLTWSALRTLITWTSSRSLMMAGLLLGYIKPLLMFYFVLGFIPAAVGQLWAGRHDLYVAVPQFIYNVATPFVTAENLIIENINIIEEGKAGFWGTFWAYTDIMASLVIFVYLLKFLSWTFSAMASNSSFKGAAPLGFAFLLLIISEFAVLSNIAVSEAGGDLSAVFSKESMPLRGLITLGFSLPILLEPFINALNVFADDPPAQTVNDTISAVVNQTDDPHGGVLSGIGRFVCDKLPVC